MSPKVSTAIVLLKKERKKNGTYPAKLRVTFNRKQRYYSIDTKNRTYEFTNAEFNKIIAPKPRGIYKDIALEFSLIEEKAQKIIQSLEDFSFATFKVRFGITGSSTNIFYYFDLRTKELENADICHNGNHNSTKVALQKFFKREKQLDFREITPTSLKEFEKWMLDNGKSRATVMNYTGSIRYMFNRAQKDNVIPRSIHPFGKYKYRIPQGSNIKKALKLQEIEKIYNYKPEYLSHEDEARDMWLFSYLCNGMNIIDICQLKYEDVGSEFITFYRQKTKESAASIRQISAPITDDIRHIINKWGNKDKSPNNYVFPFLCDGLTTKQKFEKIAWRVQKINKHMDNIGKALGIEKRITSYTARHSFATILKRSGVPTSFISESLGHYNLKTTELYLDSFENEQKKEMAKHLTSFKHVG